MYPASVDAPFGDQLEESTTKHKKRRNINMCYIIITTSNLVWFLCTLFASMLLITALVTPKWLIGPNAMAVPKLSGPLDNNALGGEFLDLGEKTHASEVRYPSVGIYTRCTVMHHQGYHCGAFDLDGFATDSTVYPNEWKATMFFLLLGFILLSITVLLTLVTCCRQSAFGKSLHNMTACAQVLAGISVLLSLFMHPLGWRAQRVQRLCGMEVEPFYLAGCSIGSSMYCASAGALLTFVAAALSVWAESSNLRTRVRRRVEEGNMLVCIP
ncbi:LHFPL tetraspan subfamily member 2a protein [Scaptodrosophila lebanonensis]|uniref:LHFPL tetraspan subfamily member 2a protein n=1 Tax=Drosophila lebanonensis TaxID=7225 RepID=A0A6J2TDE2_DROLE|nr:LHFPL tetraspan subfamily member 2a protein [Scaptodrosophila lebanonensis]